jgi:hypothetical protein
VSNASYQCPFCDHAGGEVVLTGYSAYEHYPSEFQVQCTRCGARGPTEKSEQDAVHSWKHLTARAASGKDGH